MSTAIPKLDFTDLRIIDGDTGAMVDAVNATQTRLENWSAAASDFSFEANATTGLSLNGGTLGGALTVGGQLQAHGINLDDPNVASNPTMTFRRAGVENGQIVGLDSRLLIQHQAVEMSLRSTRLDVDVEVRSAVSTTSASNATVCVTKDYVDALGALADERGAPHTLTVADLGRSLAVDADVTLPSLSGGEALRRVDVWNFGSGDVELVPATGDVSIEGPTTIGANGVASLVLASSDGTTATWRAAQ